MLTFRCVLRSLIVDRQTQFWSCSFVIAANGTGALHQFCKVIASELRRITYQHLTEENACPPSTFRDLLSLADSYESVMCRLLSSDCGPLLHFAIQSHNLAAVRTLLDVDLINTVGGDDLTPLAVACGKR